MEQSNRRKPIAYLLTFSTYGSWLHGDVRGSTGRGCIKRGHEPGLEIHQREALTEPPFKLGQRERAVVREVIEEVCQHRGWTLLAASVSTKHGHVALKGDADPEYMLGSLKARATRILREKGFVHHERKIWNRSGSTKYLWTNDVVDMACRYVKSH
jgi:REP element-mobilizing transposase RayT